MSSISTHPWQQLGTSDALMSELHRELAPGHALFGVPLNAIARRLDSDDVLVSLNDGSGRVALVHLTWRGKPETDVGFPRTAIYSSIAAFESTLAD